MGEATAIFGRITTYGEKENKHNLEMVSQLPSQSNGYSTFTKEMFNQNTLNGKMDYTIGFARSYKNEEHVWQKWIDEFESLLLLMKWENVKVVMDTEFYGSHEYFWQSKNQNKNTYDLVEKENWYFGGGHRNFWGMKMELGWDDEIEELATLRILSQLLDKSVGSDLISEIKGKYMDRLTLRVNKDGLRSVLSNLIKMYLDSVKKEKANDSIENYNLYRVFSSDSKIDIREVEYVTSDSKTKWVHKFVDWLIDKRNGSL